MNDIRRLTLPPLVPEDEPSLYFGSDPKARRQIIVTSKRDAAKSNDKDNDNNNNTLSPDCRPPPTYNVCPVCSSAFSESLESAFDRHVDECLDVSNGQECVWCEEWVKQSALEQHLVDCEDSHTGGVCKWCQALLKRSQIDGHFKCCPKAPTDVAWKLEEFRKLIAYHESSSKVLNNYARDTVRQIQEDRLNEIGEFEAQHFRVLRNEAQMKTEEQRAESRLRRVQELVEDLRSAKKQKAGEK